MTDTLPGLRTRNIYQPDSNTPFRLSRSKIEQFLDCPKCFYLDRRLGVKKPFIPPFTLNLAVDKLLKKEFDHYRLIKKAHPIMEKYGLDMKPAQHDSLNDWRNNFKGVGYLQRSTRLRIFGSIDDLWINDNGQYSVVDYKSTSKNGDITALSESWQNAYKRQMEIYQFLLEKNGLSVSRYGYFLYCNGNTSPVRFNRRLDFDMTLIPYLGDWSWVEATINQIYDCLNSDVVPDSGDDCSYCDYNEAVKLVLSKV